MTSFYENCNHYKKMLELQEKLRKSEEERIRLEERFKILVQESRNRHDACINRLRLRYIEFLEEQRARDERNYKLLEALDRVDNDLASMTAKTDKLNALRKQYEAYLRRIYTVPSPSTNIIDGGNAMNESEDRYTRRDAVAKQISLENTSVSQLLRLDGHKDQSKISPSASTRSARNTFDDYYQRNIDTQPRIISSQSRISRKNAYPPISQTNETIEQPAARSLQHFERKQSHVQFVDPNLHPIPRVSSGRLCSSSEQTTLSRYNFNKPVAQRMEISRTASHFVAFPEHINGNVSPYTSLNVSQNRFAPTTVDHARPSSSVHHQPFQQNVEHKVSLHDMETQTRPYEASSVYKTTATCPVERDICCTPSSSSNRSPNLSKQATPRYYYDYTWKKPDRFRSRQRSVVSSVVRPLVTSGIDHDTTRHRYQYFTPETNARVTLSARQSAVEQQRDESRTATIVENELDRYIDKIRRLHRDLDAQSLEETIEQEELDFVPLSEIRTVDRSKEKNLPEVVEKVLALADDLASRSADDSNVANVESGKKGRASKNRCVEFVQAASDGTPILERNDCETSAAHAKREISGDIELREARLDSRRYVKNSENEEEDDPKMEGDEQADFTAISSGDKAESSVEQDTKNEVTSEDIQREEEHDENDRNVCIAAESNLEQYLLDIVDELEPWSVDLLQKRVKEVDSIRQAENQSDNTDTPNQDRVKQTEPPPSNEMKTAENEESKKEDSNEEERINSNIESERESIEHLESKEKVLANEKNESSEITSVTLDQKEEYKDKSYENIEPPRDQTNEQNEFEQKRRESDEINVPSNITAQGNEENVQDYEYSNENYYEDSNQAENYPQNYETEYTGSNEGYNYDRTNASYEDNQGENYDQNMSYNTAQDQEQNYDPNAALYDADDQRQNYEADASYKIERDQNYEQNVYEHNQSQEYQEYINQDYARGSGEQYGEYSGEQYGSENQYEHDPNVQYQGNIADQQYSYAYDQQYDTVDQENDPNDANQCFAYTDYDRNQAQLVQEDGKPNEELQGEPKHDEAEGNADTAQRKNETSVSENDKGRKKDVVKSSLDTDTDSTIERNVSNTESDFDFN